MLNKQEAFRRAFDDFDWDKVAAYDEARQAALYADPGIIRNRRKIAAAVGNAAVFAAIRQEFGSFDSYLWQWTGGKTLVERGPTTSPLSDAISKDLKKRGMKFVGSTIIYAYLQAVGVLYAHEPGLLFGEKMPLVAPKCWQVLHLSPIDFLCYNKSKDRGVCTEFCIMERDHACLNCTFLHAVPHILPCCTGISLRLPGPERNIPSIWTASPWLPAAAPTLP